MHFGYKPTNNYIIVPQTTKKGYALAEVGDGVYTNRCSSKSGVVQKSIIPTFKTSVTDIDVWWIMIKISLFQLAD